MATKDKKSIRLEALSRRDSLTPAVRSHIAQKIVDYIDVLVAQISGNIIAAFWPIRSEIDPRPLMNALKNKGYSLALPAIIDKEEMIFRAFNDEADLIEMGFGTRGPSAYCSVVEPSTLLVPLAAFDNCGNRIGYGAGYYDRAITQMIARGNKPDLIGLGFDCQQVQSIPAEPHDQPLAMMLTESGLRNFQKYD